MFDFSLFFNSHRWCPINRKRQKISSKVVCKVLMSKEWVGGKVHNHWTIKLISDIVFIRDFIFSYASYLSSFNNRKANYLIWTKADCSIDKAREKTNPLELPYRWWLLKSSGTLCLFDFFLLLFDEIFSLIYGDIKLLYERISFLLRSSKNIELNSLFIVRHCQPHASKNACHTFGETFIVSKFHYHILFTLCREDG